MSSDLTARDVEEQVRMWSAVRKEMVRVLERLRRGILAPVVKASVERVLDCLSREGGK